MIVYFIYVWTHLCNWLCVFGLLGLFVSAFCNYVVYIQNDCEAEGFFVTAYNTRRANSHAITFALEADYELVLEFLPHTVCMFLHELV